MFVHLARMNSDAKLNGCQRYPAMLRHGSPGRLASLNRTVDLDASRALFLLLLPETHRSMPATEQFAKPHPGSNLSANC